MKKIVLVALSVLLIGLIVAVFLVPKPADNTSNKNDLSQMPNPAAKFCVDQGYNHTIRTAADGSQTGYCLFPNGNECDEWAFFRGECKNE